jgi:hypothetical protein
VEAGHDVPISWVGTGGAAPGEWPYASADAAEPLVRTLQHLLAGTDLGAAIHFLDPQRSRLRLFAMAGLPPAFAEAWNQVPVDQGLAQAQAVRSGRPVGPLDVSDQLGNRPGPGAACPPGARILVQPLGPQTAPVGTLSVLLDRAKDLGEAWAAVTATATRLDGHLAGLARSEAETRADTSSEPGTAPGATPPGTAVHTG